MAWRNACPGEQGFPRRKNPSAASRPDRLSNANPARLAATSTTSHWLWRLSDGRPLASDKALSAAIMRPLNRRSASPPLPCRGSAAEAAAMVSVLPSKASAAAAAGRKAAGGVAHRPRQHGQIVGGQRQQQVILAPEIAIKGGGREPGLCRHRAQRQVAGAVACRHPPCRFQYRGTRCCLGRPCRPRLAYGSRLLRSFRHDRRSAGRLAEKAKKKPRDPRGF